MCGIVGAVAERNVTPILLEGLRRLEYRGYDSAGIAVLNDEACIDRVRRVGKVKNLSESLQKTPIKGFLGIAHTRWATHGEPSEPNAHPHICDKKVAVVHNGIIENHALLREQQKASGYTFTSETDTEVVAHQVQSYKVAGDDLLTAVKKATQDFEGAYALGVIAVDEPGRLITTRSGSPLVIGVGFGEYFIASDVAALLPVTQRFIFLEEGDIADITKDSLTIYDKDDKEVEKNIVKSAINIDDVEKGQYDFYMMKEIHEQPDSIIRTIEGRIYNGKVMDNAFGADAAEVFDQIKQVQIIACGTSYHAGMVARYWMESLAGIPCNVEVASEFRYRNPVVTDDTLIVTISQSGETADTLAALRNLQEKSKYSLAVCNVPESSLVRESNLVLMTRAGPEIGVASTKAFTTQLVGLMLMTLAIGKRHGLSEEKEKEIIKNLQGLPSIIEKVLEDNHIEDWADEFKDTLNSIFLGRGVQYPIALEGALKLKEISYLPAEGYPAGEMKHGPLALIEEGLPVVILAPKDRYFEKTISNMQEVIARGGQVITISNHKNNIISENVRFALEIPKTDNYLTPFLMTVPLQLLAYHVASLKNCDIDKPRNLAKSVTVE